ncbi:MAG: glycogen synthase, partial [Candidatus Eisenbacteria bacterium]
IVLPLYGRIRVRHPGLALEPVPELAHVAFAHGPHRVVFSLATTRIPGSDAPVFLVDCPPLFGRDAIYTQDGDEHLRFAVLTRAALEICQRWGWAPDVFHLHDWHTALLPLYLRTLYAWDRMFAGSRTLLTIHNLGHQGVFGSAVVPDLGLGGETALLHQEDLKAGRVSFLKTGLLLAHRLSTVSPTYAREIQTPEYGFGLDGVLRARGRDLAGILNGIDADEWNPRSDPHLVARYSEKSLHRKEKNKEALLQVLGLPYTKGVPVLGIVSRLSPQKGIELLYEPIPALLARSDVRFVALGSGGGEYESFLRTLAERFPGKACFYAGFSEKLAHLIEAGSDFFLMPSRYEPCGLNQMYSLRYGTAPVVRATGGLADTVRHFDPRQGTGNGFSFEHFTAQGLAWAIDQGLASLADAKAWRALQRNAMAEDFSWQRQGPQYEALYASMRAGAPSTVATGSP